MNKSSQKVREKTGAVRSAKKLEKSAAASAPSQETLATLEFWRDEIQNLQNQQFSNTAEALNVLIEKVLARFPLNLEQRKNTQEFLLLLLDTDEEFKEELERAIKGKQ